MEEQAVVVADLAIAHRSAENLLFNTIIQRIAGMCSIKDQRAAEEKLITARAALDAAIEVYRGMR